MRLDSFETVGEFYIQHYGPLDVYEDRKGIHIVSKSPSLLTDLMVRIECLFQAISNSFENLRLRMTTNTSEGTEQRHIEPDGAIQSLQNLVSQGKNKLRLEQDLTPLQKTKLLSEAYFKAVVDPRKGLEQVFAVYAAEKVVNTALSGADVVLKGADIVLEGANSFVQGFSKLFS
ncbi:MAG: hypothetical protein H0U49_00680 [Parachlamydiaceae bacterium]|nr:hypothetical protein [Parachlamydiaceae bacterium]